ncbi:hypothetical protein PanWU01x14_259670 [Parasponia andersonii]|uniref:Uncharacterized protein n=1 Tax=Parasponia andersonii TaxID=3476 RepID=A0A2P5B990_PARAD|nr:hypothetical protein PanWU01x14_259670 [Parasponia andersonii]
MECILRKPLNSCLKVQYFPQYIKYDAVQSFVQANELPEVYRQNQGHVGNSFIKELIQVENCLTQKVTKWLDYAPSSSKGLKLVSYFTPTLKMSFVDYISTYL